MWPTDQTLPALLSGLLPIGYVLWVAAWKDVRELVSLRFIAVFATWYAYHLNSWLSYFMGRVWDSHLVVPQYIDQGLWFASLCMVAMVIGYDLFIHYWKKRETLRAFEPLRQPSRPITLELKWLSVLTAIFLISFVWYTGGLGETWRASQVRLNPEYDLITRTVGVVIPLVAYVLAVLVSVYFFQNNEEKELQHYALASLLLLLASAQRIFLFSRAAGQAFMILGIVALAMRGRKGIPTALVCLFLVYWMGGIGLEYRSQYNPGWANYFEAAVSSIVSEEQEQDLGYGDTSLDFSEFADNNFNNAMDPWTLRQHSKSEDRFTDEHVFRFFWNLHPVPSAILPSYPIGEDLTVIVGSVGFSGVTTPMMATVYYVFGYMGALFYAFLGAVYAWFNTLAFERRTPTTILCWLMGFVGIGIGLHSDVRASTRSIIYAGFFYLVLETGKWLWARYRDETSDPVPKELHRR